MTMCALSCRIRCERLIRPTKTCKFNILQDTCRPDKRSASGNFAFGEKKPRRVGLRHMTMCALSCRMRRERLTRPTKTCKFNILQDTCRPDKRSASGNFAFGEKKTRRAGLEISRKEYLTERRLRSVPGMLFPDERSSKSDQHAAIRADRSISCSADLRLSGCPTDPAGKLRLLCSSSERLPR